MDLITLAMPVYNVEKYVEKALLSALNQTYKNIEYIIVDDRGTDKSMEIVRCVLSKHLRGENVKIIEHERNIGTGATKNTTIENAKGKYLFFMDSDDEISPDCIEKLYAKMQEEPVDFVIGSYRALLRTGETIENRIFDNAKMQGHLEVARQFFEKRNKSLPVVTWNKLYRLSFLCDNRILCNPSHIYEDSIFSLQVFLNAFSCSFVPDITYFYYDTPDSLVNKIRKSNLRSSRFAVNMVEISAFYRQYAQNYRKESIYESILIYIVNTEYFHAIKVNESTAIPESEKKKFLKEITVFPVNFREISRLKKGKLFFYMMWLIFKMPFKIPIFILILQASILKKKG
jgi:glycosyltransferase involved in cell wall biosynthesis